MLNKYWRLRMVNSTDQTLTYDNAARIAIRMAAWKLGASGALSYATITDDLGFGAGETIAAAAQVEGSVVNNTSTLYYGIKGTFGVLADANSTDGTCDLYLEESEDNSQWPSAEIDFDITKHMILLCRLTFSTGTEDDGAAMNFEF